ncbi:MAG: hypothetical protein KBA61_03455 [Spirochaetes bacterium]|nr:hypothetical protein [Spirochaetota bacterium]
MSSGSASSLTINLDDTSLIPRLSGWRAGPGDILFLRGNPICYQAPTLSEITALIIGDIAAALSQTIPIIPKAVWRIVARVIAGAWLILYKYGTALHRERFVQTASSWPSWPSCAWSGAGSWPSRGGSWPGNGPCSSRRNGDGRNSNPSYLSREPTRGFFSGFIISENLHRRHLNESQRAVVAARLANMKSGTRTDLKPRKNSDEVVSAQKAANMLNVSRDSVFTAKRVMREAPEKIKDIEGGKTTLHRAKQEIKLKEVKEMALTVPAEEIPDHLAATSGSCSSTSTNTWTLIFRKPSRARRKLTRSTNLIVMFSRSTTAIFKTAFSWRRSNCLLMPPMVDRSA